jgi:ankyrin repeat protein
MLASIKQDLYVVKLLLDNNANINEVNNRGHTALFIALIYHSSNSAIYLLEQENIDINIKDVKGQTIFDFLSEKEDKKHCKAIIKLYEKKLNEHQKYYENLLEKKLKKQKEELYEEIYAPSGIGYEAAKNRFENKN